MIKIKKLSWFEEEVERKADGADGSGESIDAANPVVPPCGLHSSKNDLFVNFSFIKPAR